MSPPVRLLEVRDLHLAYGEREVVHGLSFSLERGAIGCLLGPSGCGKTTVLRCVAGFEPPRQGEVLLNGARVSTRGFLLPPEKRRIGMVFQDFALFPHLTVADNIAFGLRAWPAREREARLRELAAGREAEDGALEEVPADVHADGQPEHAGDQVAVNAQEPEQDDDRRREPGRVRVGVVKQAENAVDQYGIDLIAFSQKPGKFCGKHFRVRRNLKLAHCC